MRRHTLVWLAAPLVALTLAGCGEKDADEYPASDSGMTTDSPVTGPVTSDPSTAAPGYTPPPAPASDIAPEGTVAPYGTETPEGEVLPPPDE